MNFPPSYSYVEECILSIKDVAQGATFPYRLSIVVTTPFFAASLVETVQVRILHVRIVWKRELYENYHSIGLVQDW